MDDLQITFELFRCLGGASRGRSRKNGLKVAERNRQTGRYVNLTSHGSDSIACYVISLLIIYVYSLRKEMTISTQKKTNRQTIWIYKQEKDK